MYYIYHIPNFVWNGEYKGKIGKIGCAENPNSRVKKQGYSDYKILETHTDIYKVSERELELQKKYGYPVDKKPYYQTTRIGNFKSRSKGGKLGGGKNSKPILQYDLDGNFIKEWESIYECSKVLNISASNIVCVCNPIRKEKTAGGFQFKHKSNKIAKKIKPFVKRKTSKPILQYDLDGNFIKEWESISECARILNLNKSGISQVCTGRVKTCAGFIWKFKENNLDN
jgi:hypothetical protein